MKHNQFLKNERLTQQLSFMKKEIKEMQKHIMQLEETLSEIPFTRDWFVKPQPIPPKIQGERAPTPKN